MGPLYLHQLELLLDLHKLERLRMRSFSRVQGSQGDLLPSAKTRLGDRCTAKGLEEGRIRVEAKTYSRWQAAPLPSSLTPFRPWQQLGHASVSGSLDIRRAIEFVACMNYCWFFL